MLEPIHRFVKTRVFYALVFAACLLPGAVLALQFYQAVISQTDPGALGGNPTETLLHTTGRYAVIILILTLAITPIRRLTGWNAIQKVRRMVGVWSFTYAVLHLSTYLVFNMNCFSWETCNLAGVWEDVSQRKFIFMGMFAFVILLSLAITSTNGWMRRLKRKWTTLHRLVYVAAISAVIHYAWGQKLVIRKPLQWGAVLAVLLLYRVYLSVKKRKASGIGH